MSCSWDLAAVDNTSTSTSGLKGPDEKYPNPKAASLYALTQETKYILGAKMATSGVSAACCISSRVFAS